MCRIENIWADISTAPVPLCSALSGHWLVPRPCESGWNSQLRQIFSSRFEVWLKWIKLCACCLFRFFFLHPEPKLQPSSCWWEETRCRSVVTARRWWLSHHSNPHLTFGFKKGQLSGLRRSLLYVSLSLIKPCSTRHILSFTFLTYSSQPKASKVKSGTWLKKKKDVSVSGWTPFSLFICLNIVDNVSINIMLADSSKAGVPKH